MRQHQAVASMVAGLWLIGTGLAAGGEKAAADTAGGWSKLFADQEWYKQKAGAEQVFRGKLERLEPPPLSTLMRSAFYRLGERTVYTAARKVAALDQFVGADVEIRGKAVDLALEGQNVREIWPAAVRPASPDAGAKTAADRVPLAPPADPPAAH